MLYRSNRFLFCATLALLLHHCKTQNFFDGGDIFNDGLPNPCEQVEKWITNTTLGADHGLAFGVLKENCITIKILKSAMDRVKTKLGLVNLPVYEVDRFLQHSKPGNAGDLFKLTAEFAWINSLQEVRHGFTIDGGIKFSWMDTRFSWKNEESLELRKVEMVYLHGHRSVWLPDLVTDQDTSLGVYSQVASRSANPWAENGPGYAPTPVTMQNVHPMLYKNGTVQVPVGFIGPGVCSMNVVNYPRDSHTCCTRLSSQDYPDEIKFYILNKEVNISSGQLNQRRWKLLRGYLQVENVTDAQSGRQRQYLKACLHFQRFSNTIYAETVVPLVATLILIIFLPLFVTWKMQLYLRLLMVILLVMNFQYLLLKSTQFEYGNTTPTIVRGYNAVIWITVVSLVVSTMFYGLAHRQYSLPPNHQFLTLATYAVNCCTCSQAKTESLATSGTVSGDKKHSEDWYNVYKGLNTLLTLLCSAIYVICVFVFTV